MNDMTSMQRVFITPESEAHWLSMRHDDVTSTEIAALFGCHSYGLTEFELYHLKRGTLEKEWNDNERMVWGRRMEATIAMGIAEDLGLAVEPFKDYGRIPALRMGSSFDFKVVGLRDDWTGGDETYRDLFREHGSGLVEVKNVDGLVFRRGWIADADNVEAPPQIELQIQHQLEVAGLAWALGAPLIGGNTPKPFYRMRDKEIGAAIRERVTAFWHRVDTADEPLPDFNQDGDTLARLYLNDNGETVDMTDNERLAELCAEYQAGGKLEKDGKAIKDAAKAEMLTIIGENAKVAAAGFSISATTVKANEGTLITAAMVGERYGARRSYRGFRLTAKKS